MLFLTSYSYAETWKTEYKYYSNEYVKAIVKDIASQNRDKKKKTVYYIDSAMLNSACLIAKKNAHGFFESMNYASLYPNAKFRVVFGECENDEPAGQKDEFWEVKVSVPTEFQRAELEKTHDDNGELIIPISKDKRLTPEEICKKKPPLSGSQSGVRSISGERYIYVEGCEYIATGDVLICFENSDICNATAWIPTGEVAEGKGYGKTNNNAETALVHSFCESQYGTYGDIITSDDYVVTDRCKPVFKENKFLGWSGSGAYSDMNNPPYFPDTGIFRVVPDPEYSSSGFSSGTSKHKVEYNLNYLTLHPDLDLARYPLPVYSDLPLSSPSGSDSINLGSTTHSVDAGSRIAGSSANTESATHSLSSSGTSQSGVSSSSGAASNFGQSSGSAGNGQGSDL